MKTVLSGRNCHEKVKLTERSMKHAYDDQKSLQGRKFVAEKY